MSRSRCFTVFLVFNILCVSKSTTAFVTPIICRSLTCKRAQYPLHSTITLLQASKKHPSFQNKRKKRLATGMAFLTGWTDVAVFLKYQTFCTMLSGNTLWLARAFVERKYDIAAYYTSVILAYGLGLAIFRSLERTSRRRSLRWSGFLVATLFIGSDAMFAWQSSRWLSVVLLTTGYGIVNSVGLEVAGTMTFVVTGHLTKLTNRLVDWFSLKSDRFEASTADNAGMLENLSVCGGFFAGAFWASVLASRNALTRLGNFSAIGVLFASLFIWIDSDSSVRLLRALKRIKVKDDVD